MSLQIQAVRNTYLLVAAPKGRLAAETHIGQNKIRDVHIFHQNACWASFTGKTSDWNDSMLEIFKVSSCRRMP